MVIKIDSEVPYFWLNDERFRIGFDRQLTKPLTLSGGEVQLVAELFRGVSPGGAEMFAKEFQVSLERLSEILAALDGAMIQTASAQRQDNPGIKLIYSGPENLTPKLRHYLGDVYYPSPRTGSDFVVPQVTILAGRLINMPNQSQHLLSSDQVMLPVVFGDDSVRVGPVVIPGQTACVYCHFVSISRRDVDTAMMVSNKLFDLTFTEDSHLFYSALGAVAAACEDIGRRVRFGDNLSQQFFTNGQILEREWFPEDDCGCLWQPDGDAEALSA